MQSLLVLSSDEINQMIPYALICMTRYGSRWNTGWRKRRWVEEFTESERSASAKLFHQANDWTLVHGVPEQVKMTPSTLSLWLRLGTFCASI